MSRLSSLSTTTSESLLKLLISVFSLGLAFVIVSAQSGTPAPPPADCPPTYPVSCATPASASQLQTWPQGANVTVNIDPSFSAAQTSAIQQAFTNWQSAGSANGSGVRFTFTQSATPPSMEPPPGTFNAQVWNRNPPQAPGKAGGMEATDNGTNMVAQEIWINTQTTDPCATAQTAAHEVGHGFGLGECNNCGAGSSVMVEGTEGYNSTNGTYGPTTCDNNVVQAVGKYPKAKTTQTGGGGGNKGSTLQAFNNYECTTYWWVLYYSWDGGKTWVEQDRWEAGCW